MKNRQELKIGLFLVALFLMGFGSYQVSTTQQRVAADHIPGDQMPAFDKDASILHIPRDFTVTDLPAFSSRAGTRKYGWWNRHTSAITLKGDGWQVGPIQPNGVGYHIFTQKSGSYRYTLEGYPGINPVIEIVNGEPAFPAGSALTATNITASSVDLTWNAAVDDATIADPNDIYYKIIPADSESLFPTVEKVQEAKYTLTGLDAERKYSILVQAFDNENIPSSTQPRTTITTLAKPIVQQEPNTQSTPSSTPKPSSPKPSPKPSPTPTPTQTPTPSPESTPTIEPTVTPEPTPAEPVATEKPRTAKTAVGAGIILLGIIVMVIGLVL